MKQLENKPRVYLSYSARDEATAAQVSRALSDGGCDIFSAKDLAPGAPWLNDFQKAMAETDAMVLIASPEVVSSDYAALEFGAAMAWGKPVYVIGAAESLPAYLKQARFVNLAHLDELPTALKHLTEPLTDSEQQILKDVYVYLGVPTDRLFLEPEASSKLVLEFNRRSHSGAGLNRLVRELVKLRKLGLLPKLGRTQPRKRQQLQQASASGRRSA